MALISGSIYSSIHKKFVYDINSVSYAGAVGNAIMKYPDVVLSNHPVQKFAAIGKLAEKLMGDHNEDSYAYDPLRVMSEIGGKGLIVGKDVIGVGTTHVAMGLLGYRQRRPKVGVRYKNDKGEVIYFALIFLHWSITKSLNLSDDKVRYSNK